MSLFAADIYGTPAVFQPAIQPDTSVSATDATMQTWGWRSLVDPRNPVVWFGLILAVTVGAAGIAGSARVGPVRVGGSAGKA